MNTIYHKDGVFQADMFKKHHRLELSNIRDFYRYLSPRDRHDSIGKFFQTLRLSDDNYHYYANSVIQTIHSHPDFNLIRQGIIDYLQNIVESDTDAFIYGLRYHCDLMAEKLRCLTIDKINLNKQTLLNCHHYLLPRYPEFKAALYPYFLKSYKNYAWDLITEAMQFCMKNIHTYDAKKALSIIKHVRKICDHELWSFSIALYGELNAAILQFLHDNPKINYTFPGMHSVMLYDISIIPEHLRKEAIKHVIFTTGTVDPQWFNYMSTTYDVEQMLCHYPKAYSRNGYDFVTQLLQEQLPHKPVGYLMTYLTMYHGESQSDHLRLMEWIAPLCSTFQIDAQDLIFRQPSNFDIHIFVNDIIVNLATRNRVLFDILNMNNGVLVYENAHENQFKLSSFYGYHFDEQKRHDLIQLWNHYLGDLVKEIATEEILIHF